MQGYVSRCQITAPVSGSILLSAYRLLSHVSQVPSAELNHHTFRVSASLYSPVLRSAESCPACSPQCETRRLPVSSSWAGCTCRNGRWILLLRTASSSMRAAVQAISPSNAWGEIQSHTPTNACCMQLHTYELTPAPSGMQAFSHKVRGRASGSAVQNVCVAASWALRDSCMEAMMAAAVQGCHCRMCAGALQ